MAMMQRGVGYCMNVGSKGKEGCDEYSKGVFLLNHGTTFWCPRCREPGTVVMESGYAEHSGDTPFKEVRVEYDYDSIGERYLSIAVVRDESIWGTGNKYVLRSPLIKTEKRALKVAESILASLQHHGLQANEIPRTTEYVLSFDDEREVFISKIRRLGEEWEQSTLVKQRARSQQPPTDQEDPVY